MRNQIGIVLMLVLLLIVACESLSNPFLDELPSGSRENIPPNTHLFLEFPADRIDTVLSDTSSDTTFIHTQYLPDTTTSLQVLYWWGEDSDGDVVAYHYRWSFQNEWSRTTEESDTFFLPLQLDYDEYSFEIKAEDNEGAFDLSPAILRIPIANTPPEIEFTINSNPAAGSDPNIEYVTFPTRTFSWAASDLDGLQTINRIRYAIDDTSQWVYQPVEISSVTLTDLNPGLHTFYIQAIDTAGAHSSLLQFPDSLDPTVPNSWRVRDPVGSVLLIDDDPGNDLPDPHPVYTGIMDALYGSDGYSLFDLSEDAYGLPTSYSDQLAMYSYFEKVVWFHYSDTPNLPDADGALMTYLENGGNLFASSMNVVIDTGPNPPDTTWYADYSFIDMDSIFIANPTGRMSGGLEIYLLDHDQPGSNIILDTLTTTRIISRRVCSYHPIELEPGAESTDLFVLQEPRNANDNWSGNAPIAQLYRPTPSSGQVIFFSLPFHYCGDQPALQNMLQYLLEDVFQ